MSEADKTRDIVLPYLQGNVIDLGSRGEPVVPWAVQFDLHRFHVPPNAPVQMVFSVETLPFKDHSVDAVYSSHCLEDFDNWDKILQEWWRVIKPGGYLIIQVPDKKRFRAAVAAGQEDNLGHKHESYLGEVAERIHALYHASTVIEGFFPIDDYNLLTVLKKNA